MEKLPVELVERMLVDPQLSVADVLNVANTCIQLHKIVWDNNYFWKRKYEIMWPQFMKLFTDNFKEWFMEIIRIQKLTKLVCSLLQRMCAEYLHKRILFNGDFREWTTLLEESPRTYEYVALDLTNIIENNTPIKTIEAVPLNSTPGNNTLMYYATKALIFIRHQHLRKVWLTYTDLSEGQQTLELAATFVAQWCQPTMDIQMDDIGKQLDDIANQVMKQLKMTQPTHPLHKVPSELLCKWKTLNLDVNYLSRKDCSAIIYCMVDVMQNNCQFNENYNMALENNYFINKVLEQKTGLPVILGIIYHAVARRLGVRTVLVNSKDNFYFLEIHEFRDDRSTDHYMLDVFKKGGIILNVNEQPDISSSTYIPFSAKTVAEIVTDNLVTHYNRSRHSYDITNVRVSSELLLLLVPGDVTVIYNLAQLYASQGADTDTVERYIFGRELPNREPVDVFDDLEDVDECYRKKATITKTVPKQRPQDLQYAIGMIMKHRRMGYVCIIYDWDPTYVKGPLKKEKGVYKLKHKDQQPFYKVLADGHLYYYVAEEDLRPATEKYILPKNQDIGRYFSHFFGTHYVPNTIMEKLYPEDRVVRHSFHYNCK